MAPLHNAIRTLVVGLMVGSGVFLSSDIGKIEGKLFPVAVDYRIEDEKPSENPIEVEVSLVFSKVRNCKFVLQQAYIPGKNGTWVDVPVYDPKRVGPLFSRPMNTYSVNWLLGYPPEKRGTKIKFVLYHKCWGPGLWDTVTEVDIPSR